MNADRCKKDGETMASSELNTNAAIVRRRLLGEHHWPTETISVYECSLAVSTTIPMLALHFVQNHYFHLTTGRRCQLRPEALFETQEFVSWRIRHVRCLRRVSELVVSTDAGRQIEERAGMTSVLVDE